MMRGETSFTLRRTPWIVFVVVLLVASLVATGVLWLRPDPGPLEPPLGSSAVGAGTQIGVPWSAAAIDLTRYEASGDAVLDAVEAVGVAGGMRILGYRVVEPDRPGAVGIVHGFPPSGYVLADVAGHTFERASAPPQIVVGVEATRTGRAVIAGFRLRYHVGGRHFTASFAEGVYLCVPEC